ncbi:MAG: AAA family ATPase [Chloroflexota bacterium]
MRQSWQEALRDRGQLVALRGPLGSGKSHLARHFLEEVRAGGRLALFGQCDERGAAPFGALRSALDGWASSLSRMTAPQRLMAEQRLRIAAGDFAGLLKLFSPAFERVFEAVPAAPESDLMHERFYDILAEFLLKLAGCYGGLALCIDDAQWLDTSTRQVMTRVAARSDGAPLLLLGAIRTDQQTRRYPGTRFRDAVPAIPRLELRLAPLADGASNELIGALLGVDWVPDNIVAHVTSWTSGNPLAITEYVESLLDAGVLRPEWGGWALDSDGLERLEIPRDVVELLTVRIGHLSPAAAEILTIGSLLGGPVRAQLLQAVAGQDADVEQALNEGVGAHILRPSGPTEYEFSHDRVRQALTGRLSPDGAKDLHQRIGDALAAMPNDDSQRIYAIARHYSLGHTEGAWQRVYDANLAAGIAAMTTFADAEAYEFLQQAASGAASGGVPPGAALDEALGEVCVRAGRWDEALLHLGRALETTSGPRARAGLHSRLARVYIANRDTQRAWDEVERGFREMGTPMGWGPVARLAYTVWCWMVGLLAIRVRVGYGAARGWMRPRLEMLSQLYVTGAYVAYLRHDQHRVLEMIVRQLYTGHLLGDSIEMASALTSYANLMAMWRRTATAQAYGSRSIAMVTQLGDRFQLARMRMFEGWRHHVAGFPRRGEVAMRRCLQLDGTWLDAADFAYGHIDLAWNLLLRGYSRDALGFMEAALLKAQPNSGERQNLEIKAAAILATLGRAGEALERIARTPVPPTDSGWLRHGYFSFLLLMLLEQGELGEPVEYALREYRASVRVRPKRTTFHGRHFFVFQAYARLEQCMRQPNDANLWRLREAVSEMREISRHPTLGSHYLALRGAQERLHGHPRKALTALLEAEAVALRADNVWALFHIHRQLAHALAEMGNHEAGLRQAREAQRLAFAQGWVNRAQLIRSEFDSLRPTPKSGEGARALHADAERDPARLEQHLEGLLQVSLAASATLDPSRQAQVALDELLRVLQAQRAFLFTLTPYGELQLRSGRSLEGEDLPELTGYSRSVVETVRTTCEPVIVSGTEQGEIQPTDSVRAHDLRSIVAAPVLMKGDLLGVVYVDTHLAYGVFTEDDVRILTAIANHIALALQNASAVAQQTALTRANADLLEALRLRVSELQDSRRQITAAEERLRQEIAEILHSRVQSKLLVAAHQLGQATAIMDRDPAEAKRLLNLSQEQLDDVREREVREASHLLHPSIIKIGLGPAVRSLIGRFENTFKVSLEVEPRLAKLDSIVDNQLPEDLRLTAYRSVEEAMSNIARHAKASSVAVTLSITGENELLLGIRDDGVGFDSSQLQPGLGLSTIDGRVNQMGGTWQITSKPGEGAKVEVRLPLDGLES